MQKLFGTNGIRGVFAENLSLDFIHDISLSIAKYFGDGPILVGFDGRFSSPIISRVVCSTLNFMGIDCWNCGMVPTPCLEFAVRKLGCRGGIMVTASHNPPQYNGIKLIASDGVEISREDEVVIENIYSRVELVESKKKWGITKTEESSIQVYLDAIKSQVDLIKIKSRKVKVVIDAGNGVQALVAPKLCQDLGCEVVSINEKIDGLFPGRGSEPTPDNLLELCNKVIETGSDFGIAFDGDGDRSIFCDNEGKILTGDRSALLLCKFILQKNPNSSVVTCLNSSSSIEELAKNTKSKVFRTKVGSVEVSRKMVSLHALLGFEENGGFMYGKHNQVRDGAMTLALMLDNLSASEQTLSQQTQQLLPSFTTKDKIQCSSSDAKKVLEIFKVEFPNSDFTDGIKINFDTQAWIMIRPSGTEPIVRIYAEASSQKELENLISEYVAKIKSILSR